LEFSPPVTALPCSVAPAMDLTSHAERISVESVLV